MNSTQCEAVARYLRLHGTITAAEAYERLHIMRLAARVENLRKRGMEIKTTMVGEGRVKYARYSL